MKRFVIGLVLLGVLLAGSILQSVGISRVHQSLSQALEQASLAAREHNWSTAFELDAQAWESWKKWRHVTAAFADHEPLEELEQLFSQLMLCKVLGLEENYAVICSDLSHICKAISESFQISWWNVL